MASFLQAYPTPELESIHFHSNLTRPINLQSHNLFFSFLFLFSFFKLVKVNGSAVLCGTTPKTIQDKSSDFRVKNLSKIQSVLWT